MTAATHSPALIARGLRPIAELAEGRPHGNRLRYMAGCRCDLCRKSNSLYESARQQARKRGDWNGIVSAEPARAHMAMLSKKNVGRRAVHAATDIAYTIICDIAAGRKKGIRARTERRILAVTPDMRSDASHVSAKATWQRLNELLEEGFTEADLAKRLGYVVPRLQINKRKVLASTEQAVQRLHARLMA